jgi:PadR family transcriptional regulator AphA
MALEHAILVLLESRPASGYDLAQRFESGIGHFWHASHQQVYQELKRLHADGLVAFELEEQSDRPDRKVYALTASGRRALKAWLAAPAKPQRMKHDMLVKLFGGHLAEPGALEAELGRQATLHRDTLAEYQRMEDEYFAAPAAQQRRARLPYLTLRAGIRYEMSWLEWLDEARALLATDAVPARPVRRARKARREKAKA